MRNLPSVCCGEALPGARNCLAPPGGDRETGSAFFFLLYAATLGKCLQECGELEQHEITLGQSWQPAKGSVKGGGNHITPCTGPLIPRRQTEMELMRPKVSQEGAEPSDLEPIHGCTGGTSVEGAAEDAGAKTSCQMSLELIWQLKAAPSQPIFPKT